MKYFMVDPLDNGRCELYCFKSDTVVYIAEYDSEELATDAGNKFLNGELIVAEG